MVSAKGGGLAGMFFWRPIFMRTYGWRFRLTEVLGQLVGTGLS